jgi:DNA-binding NarL/FixJ family response regulator
MAGFHAQAFPFGPGRRPLVPKPAPLYPSVVVLQSSIRMTEPQLTPREQEILSLICQGLTTRDIAKQLRRSFNTIAMHRRHILKKLGVTSTAQALVVARERQLIVDR